MLMARFSKIPPIPGGIFMGERETRTCDLFSYVEEDVELISFHEHDYNTYPFFQVIP